VSVQTLRHYDKLGLLTPAKVTSTGYRLYSEQDCLRLALIRSLRGVGFKLETIRNLVTDKQSVRETVALQLELLEAQLHALKRQQVLLRAVSQGQEDVMLARFRRLDVLAQLTKLEREAFLAHQLGWNPQTSHGSPEIWAAAVLDLPDEMNETKLEAWLELAELVSDGSLRKTLHQQMRPFEGVDNATMHVWSKTFRELLAQAVCAVKKLEEPDGETAQKLVREWTEALASTLNKSPDAAFVRWLLEHFEATYDPRFERYWQLVALLKDQTYSRTYADAANWLLEGLRVSVHGKTSEPYPV